MNHNLILSIRTLTLSYRGTLNDDIAISPKKSWQILEAFQKGFRDIVRKVHGHHRDSIKSGKVFSNDKNDWENKDKTRENQA